MPTIDVPVIDLRGVLANEPGALDTAAARLDDACRRIGFFAISGHGVDPRLVEDVVAAARGFFQLERVEKDLVAPPSAFDFRGYLGMDTTALAATMGEETPPDLCESFNVSGFDDEAIRARATVEGYEAIFRENLWPARPPELRGASRRTRRRWSPCAGRCFRSWPQRSTCRGTGSTTSSTTTPACCSPTGTRR
ncbi:MAG: 2-oxoglutarate and iron-dependent oxygenase domain-containing protein [Actinomycetota bacterium]